ncbi:MAG: helix-turn-helix domain-containing protein [Actinomycetota bacterium]|nr:helix-turn-helix domain-containing protein [Actinomycetota bacterium]
MVAERRIPFVRVGRFIRFDPSAIGRWLEEQATGAGDFAS